MLVSINARLSDSDGGAPFVHGAFAGVVARPLRGMTQYTLPVKICDIQSRRAELEHTHAPL